MESPHIMKGWSTSLYSPDNMFNSSDWKFINSPDSDNFKGLEASIQYLSYKSRESTWFYQSTMIKAKETLSLIEDELKIRMDEEQKFDKYRVITNSEGQYAIWIKNIITPEGWKDTEISGSQPRCKEYILDVWKDFF